MVKNLGIKGGQITLIDDEDFERTNKFRWWAVPQSNTWRIVGRLNGRLRRLISLPRFLLGDIQSKIIDHIDRNPLNNQKANLRPSDYSLNGINRGPNKNSKSGYKGVWSNKKGTIWTSSIMHQGKKYNLGSYKNKIDAIQAYNLKAKQLFGDFAYLNPIIHSQPTTCVERS